MQKTLVFPPKNTYHPSQGLNCLYKGVPLREVVRLDREIYEMSKAQIPEPYYLIYEVNEGDELYDYPTHVTPKEREHLEKHGW